MLTGNSSQPDDLPMLSTPALQFPTDRTRASLATDARAQQSLHLSQALTAKLQALSQQLSATLSEVLLSVFQVLLYRYTGQSEIAIGAALVKQTPTFAELPLSSLDCVDRAPVEQSYDAATAVLLQLVQTQFSHNPRFSDFVAQVQAAVQMAPLCSVPRLSAASETQSNYSQVPFQVLFTCQEANGFIPVSSQLADEGAAGIAAQVDLALHLQETWTGFSGYLEYNADRFEHETINRLLGNFQTLLEQILSAPDQTIETLPILTAVEQQQILVDWNCTELDYPSDLCIHEWIEAQVDQTPEAVAVVCQQQQLTYRELNQRANQLAHYLRQIGVKPGTLVAICIEPSLEMIVGFLGVLKAGGTYVPLDPTYPHERRAYKLRDAQAEVILTRQELVVELPETQAQIVPLDRDWSLMAQCSQENPIPTTTPQDLAYVIYTSGSTGQPKGVMITHQSMVNHSAAIRRVYELQPCDRVLQFSSMSFDIIIEEVFPTLVSGATLVVRDKTSIASTTSFLQFINRYQITVLNLPTAFWHELVNGLSLLQTTLPATVRLMVVGGEKASRSSYLTWCQHVGSQVRWLNSYGPTEATVTATVYDPIAAGFDPTKTEIPIGRPLANTQTYILDRHLQPVPIGVAGELYIGGVGLSRGYLNRPELTDSKFIPHPFSSQPGSRLYKTGDIARYLPDGNLEFIGRADYQVKIRGFRIELGEIESVLEQHPAVQQAVVMARQDQPGQKRLVAYVVSQSSVSQSSVSQSSASQSSQQVQEMDLIQFLQTRLPDYMIPADVVILEAFPLTPNGKVDRHAFPAPPLHKQRHTAFVSPRDDLEFRLTQIWEQVLEVQPIGIHDNFFEMGGHSLLAARLSDQLEQVFDCHLPLTTIFQVPTVVQLAEVLRQDPNSLLDTPIVALQAAGTQPPLFLCEGICIYSPLIPYLGADRPVYGLAITERYNAQGKPKSVAELAHDYLAQIKATQPRGPYHIGGLSFGGTIAFEVAQQLKAQGEAVALLVLFDTTVAAAYQPLPFYKKLQFHFQQLSQAGMPYVLNQVQRKWELVRFKIRQRYQSSPIEHPSRSLHTKDYFALKLLNDQLEQQYQPQPYTGQVVLFTALEQDQLPTVSVGFDLGWQQFAQGGLEIHTVPGNHLSILKEPHVQVLGQQLNACLQRFGASSLDSQS